MRIEASLIDGKRQGLFELPREKNRKSKKSRKRQKKPMVVQKLFKTCKEVFAHGGAGTIPSPTDIERLRRIMDKMTQEDVGLTPDMPYFKKTESSAPPITYIHIYECEKFSICIFCLPPSGVIPLHNHPGMTVFNKLLFGSMHIKSYDWVVDTPHSGNGDLKPSLCNQADVRLAKVKIDADFTAPCNASILYPADGGNMHCFTALTACAVLDVLGPPYADNEGRHCAYYRDFPHTSFSGDKGLVPEEEKDGYAWLEEIENPEGLVVAGAVYNGPRIMEA